ncbi:NAD(P)/FAD-dependent oxidoreductase [Mesorhizobium sp. L-8-3]|uniref:NAD(P)/FAD-dependent oxidoreductase n=1 Tax=Mesorhizobium sp. L-8-3 TaxID=2744522 RepID=UPI0019295E98|nr:FAD-dependent oxidoreductase [Mesorhizobium sp. L-8-3]BCH23362.1 D-amino-acid oxidase [Mesorhizobium sp. L-8-3]
MKTGPRVVIVGGGILGASAAWHLARAGAEVTVLEKRPEAAAGVTRWSYGWVGTSSGLPSSDPACFSLEMEAVREFARLADELGPLPIAARGAVVWRDIDEETAELVAEQQAAGVRMELLDRAQIAELEPRLAAPPALAAWAPDDFAVEPADLTRQLLAGARAAGALLRCSVAVEAVEMRGGRVAGVHAEGEIVAADTVVLANAGAALPLVASLGITLPISEAPAVLMRFASDAGLARHLLYDGELELRPGLSGGLVSAADYPEEGEAGLLPLAKRTAAKIASLFAPCPEPRLLSVTGAFRPMTGDGLPLRKFLPEVEGLYVLVAHPGVILAPRLGRLAAHDIV